MKILLVGVGGVGEAFAVMLKDKPWVEKCVLADYDVERTKSVLKKLNDDSKFVAEFIDAKDQSMIEALVKKHGTDVIMNGVDPIYNETIFDAAFATGSTYLDMAMTLSEPHPVDPFNKVGVKLGDYQFDRAKEWEKNGLLALVGIGVEPGMADVFARYAQDYLFDEIEELGVRDGSNIEISGYEFAPNFSIWT